MALAQLREQSRKWGGTVHSTEGYLRAVQEQSQVSRRNIAKPLLLGMRRNFAEVLKLGEPILQNLKKILRDQDNCNERDIQDLLSTISTTIEALRSCLAKRPRLLAASRLAGVYWSDQVDHRLHDLLEGLEDAEETLALGLSEEFHAALATCRAEAGLEPIRTNGDSGRDSGSPLLSAGDQGPS